MKLLKALKQWIRQLCGKDLPKAIIINEKKPDWITRYWEQIPKEWRTPKEEEVRQKYFPEPTTHRRRIPHSRRPPAMEHRNAISKHMKGKGHFAPWYRKSIKQSPKIKIEEEEA